MFGNKSSEEQNGVVEKLAHELGETAHLTTIYSTPVERDGVTVIAAFVVPRDPDEPEGLDAAPLLAFAHAHLAAYKCPREIIFTDALPRTANGKVRRRDLARHRLLKSESER